jgi:hypothetical protein
MATRADQYLNISLFMSRLMRPSASAGGWWYAEDGDHHDDHDDR